MRERKHVSATAVLSESGDFSVHSAMDLERVATELTRPAPLTERYSKPVEEIGPLLSRHRYAIRLTRGYINSGSRLRPSHMLCSREIASSVSSTYAAHRCSASVALMEGSAAGRCAAARVSSYAVTL